MSKLRLIVFCLAASLMIFSCKKDEEEPEDKPATEEENGNGGENGEGNGENGDDNGENGESSISSKEQIYGRWVYEEVKIDGEDQNVPEDEPGRIHFKDDMTVEVENYYYMGNTVDADGTWSFDEGSSAITVVATVENPQFGSMDVTLVFSIVDSGADFMLLEHRNPEGHDMEIRMVRAD
ncbi:lipocalin family protein [Cytophagaceae bacterium ABcell3]|nr:lipocalin family protein [Cytophagaceae bacterium ABcell3]